MLSRTRSYLFLSITCYVNFVITRPSLSARVLVRLLIIICIFIGWRRQSTGQWQQAAASGCKQSPVKVRACACGVGAWVTASESLLLSAVLFIIRPCYDRAKIGSDFVNPVTPWAWRSYCWLPSTLIVEVGNPNVCRRITLLWYGYLITHTSVKLQTESRPRVLAMVWGSSRTDFVALVSFVRNACVWESQYCEPAQIAHHVGGWQ